MYSAWRTLAAFKGVRMVKGTVACAHWGHEPVHLGWMDSASLLIRGDRPPPITQANRIEDHSTEDHPRPPPIIRYGCADKHPHALRLYLLVIVLLKCAKKVVR